MKVFAENIRNTQNHPFFRVLGVFRGSKTPSLIALGVKSLFIFMINQSHC